MVSYPSEITMNIFERGSDYFSKACLLEDLLK
jgi:hypothetical protein